MNCSEIPISAILKAIIFRVLQVWYSFLIIINSLKKGFMKFYSSILVHQRSRYIRVADAQIILPNPCFWMNSIFQLEQ